MRNIVRIVSEFFKGENKFKLFKIFSKNARTTFIMIINVVIFSLNVAFLSAYIYVFYFLLDKFVFIADFFNNADFYFLDIFISLGVIEAFVDVYNLFFPILATSLFIVGVKVIINIMHSIRDSAVALLIARID